MTNQNLLQQLGAIFKHSISDNPVLDSLPLVLLSDLCTVVTKGTTPTTFGKPFVSEGINFLKAESILDNHSFDKTKFAHIDSETNALLKRSIILSEDIVFTIAGTLGRFALVDDSIIPANTNQAVAIIRADKTKISPEYLYSCFIGNWHNDYYTKRIQQAVQANLSLGTIKSLPIPILSTNEMEKYLDVICPLINQIKANELEIEKLGDLRDTLLPKLMAGEIDVSEIDLQKYQKSRKDNNPTLFVSLRSPHNRIQIGGIEHRLREMGRTLNIPKVHPHKFRRTLATMAIDKGMPIEQLQKLLGHQRIDTTLRYAMVKQNNVKIAHRKYIG